MTTYAYTHLKLKPIEAMQTQKAAKKAGGRFSRFNNFMMRFVAYHRDERLRQMGSPFIWTE